MTRKPGWQTDICGDPRAALRQAGKEYWRSLDELAGNEARVPGTLRPRISRPAREWNDAMTAANFLKLMGASLALAGVTGCTRQPTEKIVPYVRLPEGICRQAAVFRDGVPSAAQPTGVLVESHRGGRPRSRGNPTTRPASARPTSSPGLRAYALRPRPLADGHQRRGDQHLGRFPQ